MSVRWHTTLARRSSRLYGPPICDDSPLQNDDGTYMSPDTCQDVQKLLSSEQTRKAFAHSVLVVQPLLTVLTALQES